MNQTNNLIQWKNLTDEQKAGFDFPGYKYERQLDLDWTSSERKADALSGGVYRLVIEPDKWYYCEGTTDKPEVLKGLDLTTFNQVRNVPVIRPAKHSEIPKPKRVFKDGAFYPFVLNGDPCIGRYCPDLNMFNEIPIDEGGISWIGEELKIKWGEE